MEDKINALLSEQLAFVNAMLAYVTKAGTETFHEPQIQEIFGFDQIKFRSIRDQMNQCCVLNPYDPGVYIIIVRECVTLRNHFVSLQVHEEHAQLLSENNKIHKQQMKSGNYLLALTVVLLIFTVALIALAYLQVFPPRANPTYPNYHHQKPCNNCNNKSTNLNPFNDLRGH